MHYVELTDMGVVDLPILSLLRQEWISWHLRRYAVRISAVWPLPGESKTTKSIRKNGFCRGLSVSHAALLADFASAVTASESSDVDSVFTQVSEGNIHGCDLKAEWISVGLSPECAEILRAHLIDDWNYASVQFSRSSAFLSVCQEHVNCCVSLLPLIKAMPVANTSAPCPTPAPNSCDTSCCAHPHENKSRRQFILVYTPPSTAIETLLLPVRHLDALDPHDPRFRNPPCPLHDMSYEEDVAACLQTMQSSSESSIPHASSSATDNAAFTSVLLINEYHLDRLRKLHRPYDPVVETNAFSSATPAAAEERSELEFVRRVFCLLARYETTCGSARGFQGALPITVFRALEESLGVTGECFASPLNCHYTGAFYSAYPDTDLDFSSLGNFFGPDIAPTEGSWEANPPFTNMALSSAVKRLIELLDAAQREGSSLLFCLFTPAWPFAQFAQHIERCSWLRASAVFVSGKHAFVDGMQHREDSRWLQWEARADSRLYILSTDAAHAKYERVLQGSMLAVTKAFQDAAKVPDRRSASDILITSSPCPLRSVQKSLVGLLLDWVPCEES